jgi:hypothetical protein
MIGHFMADFISIVLTRSWLRLRVLPAHADKAGIIFALPFNPQNITSLIGARTAS